MDTGLCRYDGAPGVWTLALHVFSKEDTKGSENYYSELRALRVLRGEIGFLH